MLEGHYVEVKRTKQTTVNQVRAVKYIPLVVYSPPSESWYVVSPDEIVRLVGKKSRGQHTENPFESATLRLRDLRHCRVSSGEALRQATLDAIACGESARELKDAMSRILQRCKGLAAESIELVKSLL